MAKVFIGDAAKKDFKKIPRKDQLKIRQKVNILEAHPFAGKKLSGELGGFFALRIWPYRALYLIKKNGEVWIIHVLHRQGAYK